MCQGTAYFANNKRAVFGNTNSHSDAELQLKIDGDTYRKFEYLWWEKKIQQVHYDQVAKDILAKIDENKAQKLVEQSVKKNFNTDAKLAKWLKKVPDEWDKLFEPKFYSLAKKVNPLLNTFKEKMEKFKKQPIGKYNPYQAEKLPNLKTIKKAMPKKVGDQVWDQVGDQVRAQVGDQVWDQVGDQVRAVSYWGIKIALSLPIKHWFFDWLKLGIIVVFVQGKVKVFGKKGKYLGEYDKKDFIK